MSRRIKKSSIKFLIPLVLMFMLVGFATISTTLGINGDMELLSDLDDFNIYYSRAIVNGVEDPTIIKSSTELDFGAALKTVGVDYVIEYDITNASSAFDAQVSINCSASTEYFSINNEFDSETPIGARQTRTGIMTLRKIQTVAGDEQSNTISCDIVATPVERNEEGVGEIPIPLENPYYIGREISLGEEKFNIISDNGDTITMLAQYNIGTENKQSRSHNGVLFSNSRGWEYTPGPKEIEIQQYDGETKTLLNNYVSYLETEYNIDVTGDLIKLGELGNLGCIVPTDYAWSAGNVWSCSDSEYSTWLTNGQFWWTRSASSIDANEIWTVYIDGNLQPDCDDYTLYGVRPTITISKEYIIGDKVYPKYEIGEEVTIGTEHFNVISDNGSYVTLFAQYNLSEITNTQTESDYFFEFASTEGWEYQPAPKEIDVQSWAPNIYSMIDSYALYLSETYLNNSSVTADLITLKQLGDLGCDYPSDYGTNDGYSCMDSQYTDFLDNGSSTWTRSANGSDYVWSLGSGYVYSYYFRDTEVGVRPIITLSKETLANRTILFTISGDVYEARNGMTWGEWLDSEFNTNSELTIVEYNGFNYLNFGSENNDTTSWLYKELTPQSTDMIISPDTDYSKGFVDSGGGAN